MRVRKFLVGSAWFSVEVISLGLCNLMVFGIGSRLVGKDLSQDGAMMFFAALYMTIAMRAKGITL